MVARPVPVTAVLCAYVGILSNNWKNNVVVHELKCSKSVYRFIRKLF